MSLTLDLLDAGPASRNRHVIVHADTEAESLLEYVDVQMAGAWKPSANAYEWVCKHCEVGAEQAVLVAVHPWDIVGSQRAGMKGVWLDRAAAGWPEGAWGDSPNATTQSMADLADVLAGMSA